MKTIVEQTIVVGKVEWDSLVEFARAALAVDVEIPCYGCSGDCVRCKAKEIVERERGVNYGN